MNLVVDAPLVSVNWLCKNKNNKQLVILDATIPKVGTIKGKNKIKQQVPNAIFCDLKKVFFNKEGKYPNTIPTKEHFEEEVKKLGINQDSCIVVYDDLGVYSSPRVWWLFKLYGFENIAVLNGGFPAWLDSGNKFETPEAIAIKKGNFTAVFKKELFADTDEVLQSLHKSVSIFDARSKGRFEAITPEPRADLRGGHIPYSKSFPYTMLQENGKMKSVNDLRELYTESNPKKQEMLFTCGSGITACILALGAAVSGYKKYKVYDGSWTEWASRIELPVEK